MSARQSKDLSLPTRSGTQNKIPARSPTSGNKHPLHSYYGPEADLTPSALLDHERIKHIIESWNNSWWDLAERYLEGFHAVLIERQENERARRAQHLVAVCASLRGDWDEAIRRFIACLRTPIVSLHDLDEGNCAAFYWLGDLYAMQNRRADAEFAYALTEGSSLARTSPGYLSNLRAEREVVQCTTHEGTETDNHTVAPRSVLDPDILSPEVVRLCTTRIQRDDTRAMFDPERSRSSYVEDEDSSDFYLITSKPVSRTISGESLHPDSPWPMPYDPLFAMANVQKGRLLPHEGRIMVIPNTVSDLKLPRMFNVHTLDCFSCNDLTWLITTLRACLQDLEIEHAVCLTYAYYALS